MKYILLIIILFLCTTENIKSQWVYSPNTYYLIPPTSGCNGVWAVEYISVCNGSHTLDPCCNVNRINGDTLVFNLCSIPCEYLIVDAGGLICFNCTVWLPTGSVENEMLTYHNTIYPNPASTYFTLNNIDLIPGETTFSLHNLQGKEVIHDHFIYDMKTKRYDISDLANGIYLWKINNTEGNEKKGKLLIVKD